MGHWGLEGFRRGLGSPNASACIGLVHVRVLREGLRSPRSFGPSWPGGSAHGGSEGKGRTEETWVWKARLSVCIAPSQRWGALDLCQLLADWEPIKQSLQRSNRTRNTNLTKQSFYKLSSNDNNKPESTPFRRREIWISSCHILVNVKISGMIIWDTRNHNKLLVQMQGN